jgi:hypothetical protein
MSHAFLMANRAWPLRALLIFFLLLVGGGLAAIPAQAGFTQQGNKLVGDDAVLPAKQGSAVALSADGNTAIVGGNLDDAGDGAAWIYVRINGVWLQQGDKLAGAGAIRSADQGGSVALSADGNTAIVGGPGDTNDAGAAWVYVRDSNGVWTQQGGKLVGTGAVGAAAQGISVALSADGNTAIVGGPLDDTNAGAAWVYVRDSNGVWTPQGGKLVGTGAVFSAAQGTSVALSADGNTAVVGGPFDSGTWVFTRDSNGVWTPQGGKLVGTGAVGAANQGKSVALSADGNTAVVGGPFDDGNIGATWVFTRNGAGVWTQQGNKIVGNDAIGAATQGTSVALSGDGNTAVIGGGFDNGFIGAAWVFIRNGAGLWTQQGAKLVGTGGGFGFPQQGFSVALAADGNTAIVGGLDDDSGAGAAWVFGRPGITDISPNAGTVDGGTDVVLFGENFFDVTGVLFGGVAATNVTPLDANTVLATTPARAAGAVHVDVTTATGNSRLARGYTYERHPTFAFLSSSLNPSRAGQKVTFTAYVSGGGAAASGKVTFKDGAQTLGTVNLRNGMAKLSTTALAVGVHAIKAIFQRNGAFDISRAGLRQRVRK